MDYDALNRYIEQSGLKKAKLAEMLGLSRHCFWKKCRGLSEFTLSEIAKLTKLLHIEDLRTVFFAHEVS